MEMGCAHLRRSADEVALQSQRNTGAYAVSNTGCIVLTNLYQFIWKGWCVIAQCGKVKGCSCIQHMCNTTIIDYSARLWCQYSVSLSELVETLRILVRRSNLLWILSSSNIASVGLFLSIFALDCWGLGHPLLISTSQSSLYARHGIL